MSSAHLSQLRKWIVTSPPIEWAINQFRELVIGSISQGPIPKHIAFVMDGNRRFARLYQMETVEGHNLGFEALAKILEVCYKSGVKVVTVYAFSIENFNRSKYEVDALMEMAKIKLSQLSQHGELLERYGACIRVLGQKNLLKPDVLQAIEEAVNLTKNNGDCSLNICFPYTSRDEMTTAIRSVVVDYSKPLTLQTRPFSQRRISHKIRSRNIQMHDDRSISPVTLNGFEVDDSEDKTKVLKLESTTDESEYSSTTPSELESSSKDSSINTPVTFPLDQEPHLHDDKSYVFPDSESIDSEVLESYLFTANDPPLSLLIRTSGVKRLSDFMLWQCHENTSIVFLDCLWPDFDLWAFLPVLIEWQWKQKRLGKSSCDHTVNLSERKNK
ncbi:Dehydrodolichyl diphosphate synthase complex subunit [Erysiphe necator]|nr:Dehydrodolichyl diphosphate synthase complex subunit [Erysiphe necator]